MAWDSRTITVSVNSIISYSDRSDKLTLQMNKKVSEEPVAKELTSMRRNVLKKYSLLTQYPEYIGS